MASISSAWILGRRPWRRPASRIVRVSPAENTPVSQNTSQNSPAPPCRRGDHLLADQADVARPVIPVFLRHRVGPQEGGDQVHRVAPVQDPDGPELLQLRLRVQAVAALGLAGGGAQAQHLVQGPGGPWPPAPPGRRSGGPDGGQDAAALGQDLQIGRPPGASDPARCCRQPPKIRWVWASTRPGVTSRPPASSRAAPGAWGGSPVPTAVITPASIRTQASRSARTSPWAAPPLADRPSAVASVPMFTTNRSLIKNSFPVPYFSFEKEKYQKKTFHAKLRFAYVLGFDAEKQMESETGVSLRSSF